MEPVQSYCSIPLFYEYLIANYMELFINNGLCRFIGMLVGDCFHTFINQQAQRLNE